jgi:hypothetical protein
MAHTGSQKLHITIQVASAAFPSTVAIRGRLREGRLTQGY